MSRQTAMPLSIVLALVAVSAATTVFAPPGRAYAVGNAQTLLSTAIVAAIDPSENAAVWPDGESDQVVSTVAAYLKSDGIYTGHIVASPLQVYGAGKPISMAFSPDGSHMLIAGPSATVLYATATGERESAFFAGGAAAFSPDGTKVLTSSTDNTAQLWDIASRALTQTFVGHTDSLTSVAFSPDGSRIVTGSRDQTAKLWDSDTGQLLQTFTEYAGAVNSVTFSPDGLEVLTSGGYAAKLWDPSTGVLLRTFTGHRDIVNKAVFSPDGSQIFTTSDDLTAKRSDKATTAVLQTYNHYTFILSPDGTKFLSGCGWFLGLWDIATGNLLETFSDSDSEREGFAVFSPDGSKILAETNGNGVGLWNVADPNTPVTITSNEWQVSAAAFAPDGSKVSTTGSSTQLWNAITGVTLRTFGAGYSNYASFSPDGTELLVAGQGFTGLVDLATGDATAAFAQSASPFAAFSPDGATVLTISVRGLGSNVLELWNRVTGSCFMSISGLGSHSDISAAFSPDGTKILAPVSGRAYLWDISSPTPLQTFTGHKTTIGTVAFSPDGTKVATGSYDKTAQIWDAATGTPILTLAGHTDLVHSVAFSPDGTKVATGSADGTAKIWDAATGTVLETFVGHAGSVVSVVFSKDGLRILTGSWDGTARLWPTSDLVAPPVITQQPASLTVNQGQTASFSVASTNTTPPTYQWYKNDAALPDKTRATLTLTAVQPADAGSYACVITDETGTTPSEAATLTVQPADDEPVDCFSGMVQPSSGMPGADALLLLGVVAGLTFIRLRSRTVSRAVR